MRRARNGSPATARPARRLAAVSAAPSHLFALVSLFELFALVACPAAHAHGSDYGDPANPASTTAPLVFRGAVGRHAATDERPRAWREFFEPNGDVRADPPLAVRKPDGSTAHAGHGGSRPVTLLGPATSTTQADTIARIVSVDRRHGRVEAAHGPIPRLDMPPMTMVFRVRHPALLDALTAGESVGINVERAGATYFITGVVR